MMDYTDSNNLSAMTDEQIKKAIEALENESAYRKRQKEANLIENFKKAFYALQDAGMDISYVLQDGDYEDGDENFAHLTHWDGFYFD